MKNTDFNTEKIIGILLIIGALALFVPYTLLTITFDYPGILREETGVILTRFKAGGNALIRTWFAFALVGLPLLGAYVLLGQKLESKAWFVRLATIVGILGLVVQMIGLLRWTFVVPVLAANFANGNEMTKEASKVAFQVIHQYGGVILGEHLGQLFTIGWTILMSMAFQKRKLFPKWLIGMGYVASGIYLMAQAELFATVMPDFPVWDLAGFLGSTLWLIWLVIVGVKFLKVRVVNS
jgi:drug/metabolite transporter (DMT)-like permease